jgi:tetratricopeptide (TPR) repeat protein
MTAKGIRLTLLIAAGLAAITGALAIRRAPPHDSTVAVSVTHPAIPFRDFMSQVIEASKIADPLERCLRMPDPPGSRWHREGVAAYCRYRNQPTMTPAQFRQRIADGKANEVDDILTGFSRAQAEDARDASRLDGAFYRLGLMEFSPETRSAVDAWRKQRPQSAFALAASGFQHISAAWIARGQESAVNTPREAWGAMQEQAELARAELDRAATMQPSVSLVFADMFTIGKMTGDDDYANAAMAHGLAVAPDDMALRLIQSSMSGSRWGGSPVVLLQQAHDAAVRATHYPLLWVVVGRARMKAQTDPALPPPLANHFLTAANEVATATDLSWLADRAYRSDNFAEALILAVEAWRFDDGEASALWIIGMASERARYRDWARITLKEAARRHPDSVGVARNAAVALLELRDPAEAERLFSSAVDLDPSDTWTLRQLGWLYLNSTRRYDKARAIADSLIRIDEDGASGYALRAYAQIETDDPDRYKSIHVFLDRFEQRDGSQTTADDLRTYLVEHPEPLPR